MEIAAPPKANQDVALFMIATKMVKTTSSQEKKREWRTRRKQTTKKTGSFALLLFFLVIAILRNGVCVSYKSSRKEQFAN